MSNLYDDFEKRFTNAWFSAGWIEVEAEKKTIIATAERKNLATLENELDAIQKHIDEISQKQMSLTTLAKKYSN